MRKESVQRGILHIPTQIFTLTLTADFMSQITNKGNHDYLFILDWDALDYCIVYEVVVKV